MTERTSKGKGRKKEKNQIKFFWSFTWASKDMSLSYHSSGTPDPIRFSCQQDQLQLNWCQHNCLACLAASLSLEIFTFQSNIFQCFTVTMVGQHIFLFCFLPSVLFKLPVLHPRDINYCPFHSDRLSLSSWKQTFTLLKIPDLSPLISRLCSIIRSHCLLYLFSILFVWTPSTFKCGFWN